MKLASLTAWILAASFALSQTPVDKAKDLRGKLNQTHKGKQKLKAELARTNRRINIVVGDIKWVDSKLDDLEDQLGKTTQSLESNRARQKRLIVELKETSDELSKTKDQVRQRMRSMYMQGQSNFFSVVVGTQSVGDLVSRKVLQDSIAKKDRQIFNSYIHLQKAVASKKSEQDAVVAKVAKFERQQKEQQEDLEDARVEKQDLLGSLKDQKARQEEVLRQFEADERQISNQIEEYMRAARAAAGKTGEKMPAFKGHLARPVGGPVTSGFGMRFHPILHKTRIHAGCDFGVRTGTPVHSAGDGVVIATAYMRGYGNTVIIDHGGGIQTVYAHLSRISVQRGQKVSQGQTVAASGMTGLATAPHLHFEIHVNGHAVNPMSRL